MASVQRCIGELAGSSALKPEAEDPALFCALLAEVVDFLVLLDDLVFFEAIGCLITFARFGVADVVQYHFPLANAQVWPSLALA